MKRILLTITTVLLVTVQSVKAQNAITTIAGTYFGNSGDGGLATQASLGSILDIAADANGNLYLYDGSSFAIRKIDKATGIISRVAGTGVGGFSGDGGPATSAQIQTQGPGGGAIAVDLNGNIYISTGFRIRKIAAGTGIITTIAGTGVSGNTGDGGPATQAQIGTALGLTTDSGGNIYLPDADNAVVRKITVSTGVITRIAGITGSPGFSGDSGAATAAQLGSPSSVALYGNSLYIGDFNARIRRVDLITGLITTIAGNGIVGSSGDGGPATAASFTPNHIAADAFSNIYICDTYRNIVRKISYDGTISKLAGSGYGNIVGSSGDWGPSTSALVYSPWSITTDSNGNVYIADTGNYRIRKVWYCMGPVTLPSASPQTICQNSPAVPLSIYYGYGGTSTVQWYSNSTNSNIGGTPINGATSMSFTPPTTTVGDTYYYAGITTICGSVNTPPSGLIRVNTTVSITSQPSTAAQTGCINGPMTPLSVSITGTSTPNYQWYRNTANNNYSGTPIPGGTSTYIPNGVVGTYYYYVKVTGCNTVTSNPSGAVTTTGVAITNFYGGGNICQNAATSITVVATGPGPLTYQWYVNPSAATSGGTLISGASGPTYSPPTTSVGATYYYAVVSSPCGDAVATSYTTSVTVEPPVVMTVPPNPAAQSVCQGGTIAPLTVAVSGIPNIGISWWLGGVLVASGNNMTSFTPQTSTIGTSAYTVRAAGCNQVSATSGPITVTSPTQITVQPSMYNQPLCLNATATPLSVTATGTGPLTYQWYKNSTNTTSGATLISGATASSYTPLTNTLGQTFYFVVVSGPCGQVTSSISVIAVNNPTVTNQLLPTTATQNTMVTLYAYAIGGTPINYQWYSNTINSNSGGTLISGATNQSYTIPTSIQGTTYYYFTITSCGTTVASNSIAASVVPPRTLSTYAGTGAPGTSGDGGPAIAAQIMPTDIALSSAGNYAFMQGASIRAVNGASTIINTIAGDGTPGYSGDGGPAVTARINPGSSGSLAYDVAGNLYFTDTFNGRVRKITAVTGVITTVAGNGSGGYTGDGGPATSATFGWIVDVVVDAGGNLYISDRVDHVIRKVNPAGIISTFAGINLGGGGGFSGDGGLATSAQLSQPTYLAVDNNYLYVSDADGSRIRKISLSTNIISSVSGNGWNGFSGDGELAINATVQVSGLTVDPNGNIYFSSYNMIRRIDATTGIIDRIAGRGQMYNAGVSGDYGPATEALLNNPQGVASDANGAIYVSDAGNNKVRRILPGISSVSTSTYTNMFVCQFSGPLAPLTVTATGTGPFTYQWFTTTTSYNGTPFGGVPVPGATNSSYTPSTASPGTYIYYCVITGPSGSIASPMVASVVVSPGTLITTQPSTSPQTVCLNGTSAPLTITTLNPTSVAWYRNTSATISGAAYVGSGATYSPATNAVGSYYYFAMASLCNVVYSNFSGLITVTPATTITAQPSTAAQTICQNGTATALSVTATGPGITYQWYRNTSNSTAGGTLISGATSTSYTPASSTPGVFYFYAVVTGTCGALTSNTSGAVTVNANTAVTVSPAPGVQNICLGATAPPLSVAGTGAGVLNYQWYRNAAPSNLTGTIISGATSATYTPPAATAGTSYYYAVITGTCSSALTSVSGPINVNPVTAITTNPSVANQSVCPGTALAPLTISASGSSLTYQWYQNTTASASGGTLITGATGSNYSPSTATLGTSYYYAFVTGACGTVTSTVSGAINVNYFPQSISFGSLSGKTYGDAPFTISASASSGLGVTFSSSNPGIVSVSGNTVTINGAGSAVITANQAGNGCYSAATPVSQTLNVAKANQTVYFNPPGTVCNNQFTLTATTSSGLSNFYFASSNPEQIYVTGYTAYPYYGGAYIQAYEPGNQNYNQAWSTSIYVAVGGSFGSISQSCSLASCGYVYLIAGEGGTDYSWSDGAGGQARVAYYSGSYTVTYYLNGCWVTASTWVDDCTGCNMARIAGDDNSHGSTNQDVNNLFGVSPNPAADLITVTLSEVASADSPVSIHDMNGKQMLQDKIEKGMKEKQFPIRDLPSGIYVVYIKDFKHERYRKLVILR